MLSRLHIENIAIMDNTDIEFDKGFLVLTGETGAGKSIIIDSINLLTGERSSRELVRHGSEKAFVEGTVFTEDKEVFRLLEENGIPYFDGEEIVLSREINADGRTGVRINNKSATTGLLKSICSRIINIHGQNDNQAILDTDFHLECVDNFSKNAVLKEKYMSAYKEYKSCLKLLDAADTDESLIQQKKEMLSFKIEEITNADLKDGEDEELIALRNRYINMEKVMENMYRAKDALCGSDSSDGAKSLVDIACDALGKLSEFSDENKEITDGLIELKDKLWDISETVSDMADSIENEEIDINYIESRLDLINRLKKKYAPTIEDIKEVLKNAQTELDALENSDRNILELQKRTEELYKEVVSCAQKLSGARKENAVFIEKEVKKQLNDLEMSGVEFKINFEEIPPASKGIDKIEFFISANKGQALKPLNKIASGGELSRIILAIKVILAETDSVETMIFDEVDTGVSGSAAQKIAEKLKLLGKDKQVFAITHLPQMASFADTQYLVSKETKNEKAVSKVNKLDYDGRKKEIARIISGSIITDSALSASEELLAAGEEYGKSIRNS